MGHTGSSERHPITFTTRKCQAHDRFMEDGGTISLHIRPDATVVNADQTDTETSAGWSIPPKQGPSHYTSTRMIKADKSKPFALKCQLLQLKSALINPVSEGEHGGLQCSSGRSRMTNPTHESLVSLGVHRSSACWSE